MFLAVSIADCTPVLIYDTKNKAVAAIHAGWKGTVAEIVTHTLQKMNEEYMLYYRYNWKLIHCKHKSCH